MVRNPLDVVDSLADHTGFSRAATVALLSSRTHKLGGPDVPHAATSHPYVAAATLAQQTSPGVETPSYRREVTT